MYWNFTDKERLIESFLYADKPKLLREFFDDLFTKKEMSAYETRLKAMCLLYDCVSYTKIRKVTGLSFTTISRLSKIVANRESGFRKIIEKFKDKGKGKSYSD